jgi:glycosyltransferase involved in cell wall biosynthesis
VGGISDVVTPGITGEMLPLGDVQGMAAAALAYLEPAKWAAASTAAAADARRRFATADVVARYEKLYEEALAAVR